MSARRGSALLLCLMLVVTLFIMGMGFLSQHTSARLASRRVVLAAQARQLARAGLENVSAKIHSDIHFPPRSEDAGTRYSYSEAVYAPDNDRQAVGSYLVTLDCSLLAPPYEVLRVESVGLLGDAEHPESSCRLYAELDLCRQDRDLPAQPNPRLGHILHWEER